jgi:putative oxidoreductase
MNGVVSAPAPASRGREIGLWVLQALMALAFLGSGGAKLVGVPVMVQLFAEIGIGQWFRYLTGSLEVLGAVALLFPALAGLGALLLVLVMIGAIGTHLFVIGGDPIHAVVLLVLTSIIAWGRRDRTMRVIRNLLEKQPGPRNGRAAERRARQ